MSLKPRGRGVCAKVFWCSKSAPNPVAGAIFLLSNGSRGGSPDAGDRRGWTPDTGQKSDHQRQHENRPKSTVLILRNLIWATHSRQLNTVVGGCARRFLMFKKVPSHMVGAIFLLTNGHRTPETFLVGSPPKPLNPITPRPAHILARVWGDQIYP